MQVGSFGPVVFEVTDKKVFTPDSRSLCGGRRIFGALPFF